MSLLSELLKEEFSELRWRRDVEDRLVRWTISICTGIISGTIVFAKFANPVLLLIFCILAARLICKFGINVNDKIKEENNVYQGVGRTIVKILANDHSFGEGETDKPDIGEDIKKIGQGIGYKKTITIISCCTNLTSSILYVLGCANCLIHIFIILKK